MNNQFKNLFIVLLLATLTVAGTSCNNQEKIDAAVQATLTAESAMNATVEARVSTSQAAMPTSIPPMEPGIQPTTTPVNTIEPTHTATSAPAAPSATLDPSTPVAILSPTDGSAVSQFNEVFGLVNTTTLTGKFLNIIVITQTGETWVQTEPTVDENGNWKSFPVVLGEQSIGIGQGFEICAVIAAQQSDVGRIYSYPVGPKACVKVTRTE